MRVSVIDQDDVRDTMRHHNYDLALIGVNLSEVPDISAILESDGDLNFNC